MINIRSVAAAALASALFASENYPSPPEISDEIRLAHSLLAQGEPTAKELRPFLGEEWVIRRRTACRSDINAVTEADFRLAQTRALAARLNLPEDFVAGRLRSVSRSQPADRRGR